VVGQRQARVQDVIGGDGRVATEWLVQHCDGVGVWGRRLEPNQLRHFTVGAGNADDRACVAVRHELEPAVGEALTAAGARVPSRLAA
jgi:hypothetical protein